MKPTAQWAGLKGKKNGESLVAADMAGYEVLLTVDQGIPHQQNSATRKLSIISDPFPNNPDRRPVALRRHNLG
jgi:hypothetical protein